MANASQQACSEIKLTFLGTGTGLPRLKRSAPSALVDIDGIKLLIDIGMGTIRRLLEIGISVFEIDILFITHFHPDHTGELVSFLFANTYENFNLRKKPLIIIGGEGMLGLFNALKSIYGHWITFPENRIQIIEMPITTPGQVRFETFEIQTRPVNHNPESIACKVMVKSGKNIVYSGDTDYSEPLIAFARKANLLVCESAFPDEQKVAGHLTPSLAGQLANKAGVKTLVLTHFYPPCDAVDICVECRKTYQGRLILAEDLLTIRI